MLEVDRMADVVLEITMVSRQSRKEVGTCSIDYSTVKPLLEVSSLLPLFGCLHNCKNYTFVGNEWAAARLQRPLPFLNA